MQGMLFLIGSLFRMLLLFALFISGSAPGYTADLNSCADDLDRLRRAVRDAADEGEEAKSSYQELENCVNNPENYDFLEDRCQSKQWNYRSELDDLKNELDTVNSRISSVQHSCGYEFSTSAPRYFQQKPQNMQCQLYQDYKNKLPMETLLSVCKQSMSEADCQKCLGIK